MTTRRLDASLAWSEAAHIGGAPQQPPAPFDKSEHPSGVRWRAARFALPSVAGLVVAAAFPPALAQRFREWAECDRCILVECEAEQLPAKILVLPPDLIVVHALAALPVVQELRSRSCWTPLLYVASERPGEAPAGPADGELALALESGATSVVPGSEPTELLVRSAQQLLCASLPPYERLIITRRVVIRDAMVRVDGRARLVQNREMPLLVYLAERAGRVIPVAEVAAKALGPAVAEGTVRKWIERLRGALGDANHSIVLNVRGDGALSAPRRASLLDRPQSNRCTMIAHDP